MRRELRSMVTAVICFLLVIVLNFLLPRLLPGNPLAYLTGVSEEGLTTVQEEYYVHALHLDEGLSRQFAHYLGSLLDGTLGYSFKKDAPVSSLIADRIWPTLKISVPSLLISSALGLVLGLSSGFATKRRTDSWLTPLMIVLNAVPSFLMALSLVLVFGFKLRLLPYAGLSSFAHLILPVTTLVLGMTPSRYLLVRNMVAVQAKERYVLYARQRGLSDRRIRYSYILGNIAGPFIMALGIGFGLAVSGSVVVENIFSINGMGKLLTEAVYTLDYPLVQGVLFVSTAIMAIAIILSDLAALAVNPKRRLENE
ncbi:MAG: ABC transporter permease [Spirochaetales bacterium]|nr:ABC transporter permease [Spirochaetales bacterium]